MIMPFRQAGVATGDTINSIVYYINIITNTRKEFNVPSKISTFLFRRKSCLLRRHMDKPEF
jgi:hypothetical protein